MTELLLYAPAHARIAAELERHPGLTVRVLDDEGTVRDLSGAPAQAQPEAAWLSQDLFGSPALRRFLEILLASPNLKWVQSGAAGVDHPMFGRVMAAGAQLTTSHAQSVGMAEYTLATVLDVFQRGPERRAAQAERRWLRLPYREIAGSAWLIVGFGAIGQEIAVRARAFGARITGVRRSGGDPAPADALIAPDALPGALGDSDVVVLCTPLTDATRNLADAAFFARMKPGSILVNLGRGGLVDEPALLSALDQGVPTHAVLDVFVQEPLPESSPFWNHPRVTLTPHASALGSGLSARSDQVFLDNLVRWVAGAPLVGLARPD